MTFLRQTIDDRADSIKILRLWQTCDEVHGDILPALLWDGQGLKQAIVSITKGFAPLAYIAVLDVPHHRILHARPVEVSLEDFYGAVPTGVTDGKLVMRVLDQLCP